MLQTGPKTQLGGLKKGLFSPTYQSATAGRVTRLDKNPTPSASTIERVTGIPLRLIKIFVFLSIGTKLNNPIYLPKASHKPLYLRFMTRDNFAAKAIDRIHGTVTGAAPSNIALIKYWGKHGMQLPKNPSLSFTLTQCMTKTTLAFRPIETQPERLSFDFFFEGRPKPDFHPKLEGYFQRIIPYVPFIKEHHFEIQTANTFPHSSGIASSASAMAALSVCIMEMERILSPEISLDYFYKKASFLARLGSGSAARSIQGPVTVWGASSVFEQSTDLYAIPFDKPLHPIFENYCDTILLIDKGSKKVSSTQGHQLMHKHPFANPRFDQAHRNLEQLKVAMQTGAMDDFITLVESEALTLHAMMMTSNPYFILMHPNTLQVINHVWDYRKATQIPLCFTLDAGANVHLLYPEQNKTAVEEFIKTTLAGYCQNKQFIHDWVGAGAKSSIFV